MSENPPQDPSQSYPLFPGGEYAVEGVLGSGGMAVVYRARDLRHPRAVAIKVLRPDIARLIGPDRFLREVALTSAFTHPNILPLLDSGEATDALGRKCLFYVMPLIEGQSLAERMMKERRLPVSDAIRLTSEMLEALRYAHEHSVIHRDIKPANVLLSGGHAVVADFGVARPLAGSQRAADGGKALTETGIVVGTPEYMSPEQALGDEKVDERADLYAVACVMYEMVVGVSPFDADTPQMIVSRKISGTFTPASLKRAGLPAVLDDVLAKALSADKSDRYPSAAAFLQALEQIDLRPSSAQRPALKPWPKVSRSLLTSLVGVAAIAGLIFVTQRNKSLPAVTNNEADAKSRVAVLPIGVLSTDSSLNLVANALTGDLIDELAQYPALTVISKNGVLPFSGGNARADSVARILNVGSIVTGDMRSSGDTVKVTVRLIDGTTSRQLASVDASGVMSDVLAVRSKIIDSVTIFLREQIGRERIAVQERSASSAEAWRILADARAKIDKLDETIPLDSASRAARFDSLDVAVKRAISLDPKWPDLATFRVRLQMKRAELEGFGQADGSPRAVAATRFHLQTIALADDVLKAFPDDGMALFYRGRVRSLLWRSAKTKGVDSLRVLAEADLLAAVERRKDLADSWNELSQMYMATGQFTESMTAAEKALKADAFMTRAAPAVMSRMVFASLFLGRTEDARTYCNLGKNRFQSDPRFFNCEFAILGWMGRSRAEVGAAWRALDAMETRDSARVLNAAWGQYRFMIAGVAARAGMKDSAEAIVRRTRESMQPSQTTDAADLAEARVWSDLDDANKAISMIEIFLRHNPSLRGQVRNYPWFTSLRNDQRFQAITAPQ